MALRIPFSSYTRPKHFRKRLESIKPRMNNILNAEFKDQYLKKLREDKTEQVTINEIINEFTSSEQVQIILHGDLSAKEAVIDELHDKIVPDISYSKKINSKEPSVHIVATEVDVEVEEKFNTDTKQFLDQIPDHERQFAVLALVPPKEYMRANVERMSRNLCASLEQHGSTFEFEKCVVILESIERNRAFTRQSAHKREANSPQRCSSLGNPSSPPKHSKLTRPLTTSNAFTTPDRSKSDSKADFDDSEHSISSKSLEPSPDKSKPGQVKSSESSHRTSTINRLDRAISHQLECQAIRIVERIETYLKQLKARRDRFARYEMFTDLDKMLFELGGLFNISETKIGRERRAKEKESRMSDSFATELLRLEHVRGCGRVYSKLNVHVDASLTTDQKVAIRTAIDGVIKRHNYPSAYVLSFVQSRLSRDNCINIW